MSNIKNLTSPPKPPRGTVIPQKIHQSGPFSILPNSKDSFFLGYGSRIKFGSGFYGLNTVYDLGGNIIKVPSSKNGFILCKLLFEKGIPKGYEIKQLDSTQTTYSDIEYDPNSRWPSPQNVLSVSFLIASVLPYNQNLSNQYGNAVTFGPQGSYSVIRHVTSAIQVIQTCYGFVLTNTPYW